MWHGVAGYKDVFNPSFTIVFWVEIVKRELEAARCSGEVPRYLVHLYQQRFPPTWDEW